MGARKIMKLIFDFYLYIKILFFITKIIHLVLKYIIVIVIVLFLNFIYFFFEIKIHGKLL
jgi:hypothetical protein